MGQMNIRTRPFEALPCLEQLHLFRTEHDGFIRDNRDLASDLDRLEYTLKEADLIRSAENQRRCQNAYRQALLRLEEIAEDQQRLCDESPLVPKIDAVYQSTKVFEVKKDFETSLAGLL
ncbi:MAG: hypothetical protein HY052_03600 [Proteobacteria bacterium]|nr:hypothetical protein [Pseudomonadota bacterium]